MPSPNHRRSFSPWLLVALVVAGLVVLAWGCPISIAWQPEQVMNPDRPPAAYDDFLGQPNASQLTGVDSDSVRVPVDAAFEREGRRAFYGETFGNEIFLTDVVGLMDGPLTFGAMVQAILALHGKGTTDLQVALASDALVGDRQFRRGEIIHTGFDVPAGAYLPLGIRVVKQGGHLRAGITCALCHATVDPKTFTVIQGAPNTDIRAGLLLALGTNTSAFFAHANLKALDGLPSRNVGEITLSNGQRAALPDPAELERRIDRIIMRWPPGTFDSMIDLEADPTRIPSSFTRNAYPYGWSGFSAIGPFHGLTVLNNNVHGLNSDPSTDTPLASRVLGLDPEMYLGILLQNAASRHYRFDPRSGEKPSEFLARIKPDRESPFFNRGAPLPGFPTGSLLSPTAFWTSNPGQKVWEEDNAISAFQNDLEPPPAPLQVDAATMEAGRRVFERAGCVSCHSGPTLTNHTVIPVDQIGTEPVRARAFAKTAGAFQAPIGWSFQESLPLRPGAKTFSVPDRLIDPNEARLAFAWDGKGGYKVPALVGLYWTAPYLHDGGLSVGPNEKTQLGLAGTLSADILPDPVNSLRALVDRDLRARVVAANEADPDAVLMNVRGIGHSFWVDPASGFAPSEQHQLILFLLSYRPRDESAGDTQ